MLRTYERCSVQSILVKVRSSQIPLRRRDDPGSQLVHFTKKLELFARAGMGNGTMFAEGDTTSPIDSWIRTESLPTEGTGK